MKTLKAFVCMCLLYASLSVGQVRNLPLHSKSILKDTSSFPHRRDTIPTARSSITSFDENHVQQSNRPEKKRIILPHEEDKGQNFYIETFYPSYEQKRFLLPSILLSRLSRFCCYSSHRNHQVVPEG